MYEGALSCKWGSILRTCDRTKFVELANKRVSRALKAIQLIGNLSNRSNYDFTEEDVTKMGCLGEAIKPFLLKRDQSF